jgi:hypothetical protein
VVFAGADVVADADPDGVGVIDIVEFGCRLPGPVNGLVTLDKTLELKGTVALASAEIVLLELVVLPETQVALPQTVR